MTARQCKSVFLFLLGVGLVACSATEARSRFGIEQLELEYSVTSADALHRNGESGRIAPLHAVTKQALDRRLDLAPELPPVAISWKGADTLVVATSVASDEELRRVRDLVEAESVLAFAVVANSDDGNIDEARERLLAWLAANPDEPLRNFNRLPPALGGPPANLRWVPQRGTKEFVALMATDAEPQRRFDLSDVASLERTTGPGGVPALAFTMEAARAEEFLAMTREHVGDRLATVIGGEVVDAPYIDEPLPGKGVVVPRPAEAGLVAEWMDRLSNAMRAVKEHPLPMRLQLVGIGSQAGAEGQ